MTRLATGQMQEETQQLLDEYNELYDWEYNDMCDFIENHSEEDFREHYETYNRLVDDSVSYTHLTLPTNSRV